MIQGRKINDDELVEISGGMDIDGITDVEIDQITDPAGPGLTRREERTPGGGPDPEPQNSSDGTRDIGPDN